MTYLCIQNNGKAPIEAFQILGVTTSRGKGVIGEFGSGIKYAVNLLLRKGMAPIIYSGKEKLEFDVKTLNIDDGIDKQDFHQVFCNDQPMNMVLEHGEIDWTHINMALREIIANAIDRSIRQEGNIRNLKIDFVDNAEGEEDKTKVFVPYNDAVKEFVDNIKTWFLHFTGKENEQFIHEPGDCSLYKRGVFVGKIPQKSIFNYNLPFRLDESRNVQRSEALMCIAENLHKVDPEILLPEFKEGILEVGLDSFRVRMGGNTSWKAAWEATYGTAIACLPHQVELLHKYGLNTVVIPDGWLYTFKTFNIPTALDYFKTFMNEVMEIFDAPQEVIKVRDIVWDTFVNWGVAKKPKPPVKTFSCIKNAYGHWKDNVIYINQDIAKPCDALYKTMVEECIHHNWQCGDFTHDMQEALLTIVLKLWRM